MPKSRLRTPSDNAKTPGCRLPEVLLELVEAPERAVDGAGQLALGQAAPAWAQDFPEKRMVAVAAAIVAQHSADRLGRVAKIGDQRVDIERRQRRVVLQGIVGIVDVGLMMLGQVDFHRASIDVGLQRVVSVVQFWKIVSHMR